MDPADVVESDKALVRQYRRGDPAALEKLVVRHRGRLFSFILNMAGRADEADDIFQEVWFRAISKIDSYRNKNFLAWLTRIAHNLMIDRWRSNKANVSFDATEEEGGLDLSERLAGPEPSPAQRVESSDVEKRVSAAVAALPLEQREVFLMRVKEGLSFREIAKIQGVSINTALARMQYGLTKLRTLLQNELQPAREDTNEL